MARTEPQSKPCPKIADLKRCLLTRHGCRIEEHALFKGADNEDAPRLLRMIGPGGGFIPDVDTYPDGDEATPSTVDYFCRILGVPRADVHIDSPQGLVRVELPSHAQEASVVRKIHPITGSGGSRKKRR